MRVSEVLRTAKSNIEKGWCKGVFAQDAAGNACYYEKGAEIAAYCSLGAIGAATYTNEPFQSEEYLAKRELTQRARDVVANILKTEHDNASLPTWNDAAKRTKDEVLAVFDQAIAVATKQETDNPEAAEVKTVVVEEDV
jgi:hypothetical protein